VALIKERRFAVTDAKQRPGLQSAAAVPNRRSLKERDASPQAIARGAADPPSLDNFSV
jgi:hypothetical protein